jgi:hypothetical protein
VPVSKRLRFEVLKRDGHTCRYCGAKAPDVPLTVDHVTPVALGGRDEPSNLVTACRGCNSGKSSVSPDASIVADIDMRAALWAKASEIAQQRRQEDKVMLDYDLHYFDMKWSEWGYGEGDDRRHIDRSPDWEDTVAEWVRRGLSVEELATYIPKVMRRSQVVNSEKWTYFCGIGWKLLAEHEDACREIAEELRQQHEAEQSQEHHPFDFVENDDDDPEDAVAYYSGDQCIRVYVVEDEAA